MSNSKLPARFTLPDGFQFAGTACGIKPSGKSDISLIVADANCTCAGVYTQNQIVAAPVLICRDRTPSSSIRAVITNSGNANACTGDQGMADAQRMCQLVAQQVGCQEDQVLIMSTGIIGHLLPMDCVETGIDTAVKALAGDEMSFMDAADAIRTTDKDRKTAFRTIQCGERTYSIAAMAKGAGMIAPNMATMLAVVLTDAPLPTNAAQDLLIDAANVSFNRVSVDGHTSTNDTLLLLSSGDPTQKLSDDELRQFAMELNDLSIELAKQLVADGEGASHVMAIKVDGAENDALAEVIARTIAASPLVKTAITGGDPNWGRIVSAAGYADAPIDPSKTSLRIFDTVIYQNGLPVEFDEAALSAQMKDADEVPVYLTVGTGSGASTFWSSDLTTEYVTFNSEYTT